MIAPPTDFLVKRVRDGQCVLFVGAGLSAAAGMPDWSALLRAIAAVATALHPDKVTEDLVESALKEHKYLELAEYLTSILGRRGLEEVIVRNVGGASRPLAEVHHQLAPLPFRAVITTNYDTLLEQAMGLEMPVATQVDAELLGQFLAENRRFILKAHGDVGRPETIVLTEGDFARMVHGNEAFRQVFHTLLSTCAVLFVGYSVGDLDFRMMLERQVDLFEGKGPPRWALMKSPSVIDRAHLDRKGIQVVGFDAYPDVPVFLRQLGAAVTRPSSSVTADPPKAFAEMESKMELKLYPRRRGPRPAKMASDPGLVIASFEMGSGLEVEQMMLDDRPEVAGPLREHLGHSAYDRYRSLAEEHARRREASEGRDHVVLIPGFAGSELFRQKGSGRSTKLWINPPALVTGGVGDLTCGLEPRSVRVRPGKPLARAYSSLQMALRRRWEVLEFGYDWRKDLFAVARDLHEFLAARLAPETPCHIVAHGSGGLLVRALMVKHPETWQRLIVDDRGGRAVMLGTPHHGWFPALTLLLGQEPMLRKLAMLDLMHNTTEVRCIFASFPALYQMLPAPEMNPAWSGLYESDSYGPLGVPQGRLDLGRAFHEALRVAVDPPRMFNLLGHGQSTTCDVEQPRQLADGNAWALTTLGDGSVTHGLARLERNGNPVPTWYVDESHGALPNNDRVLGAVDEILRWGRCFNLSGLPGGTVEKIPIEEKLSGR